MKYIFSILLLQITAHLFSQTNQTTAGGEYYLQGVMEVGSGFKLNADHSFDFFFTYGALDRIAKGTWVQHGDTLILNNTIKPPKDFQLLASKHTGEKEIIIQIVDKNKMVLNNVYARLTCRDTVYENQSDQNGRMTFTKCKVQRILLVHEFWNERASEFIVNAEDKNYFEFSIEPWIGDVDFDNFTLILKEGELRGYHPMLEKKQYSYIKQP